MPEDNSKYTTIVRNRKFEVLVLDPKDERRDNIRIGIHSDNGEYAHHHLRAYEVIRLINALNEALAFGPAIPND